MEEAWIRLGTGWTPAGSTAEAFGWALWQPAHRAAPWPHRELRPGFAHYVCEPLETGGRGLVARAVVTGVLGTVEAASDEDAHRLVAGRLFDDRFSVGLDEWRANPYNRAKALMSWPQRVTAWRIGTERVGPYVLSGLSRFPRTGWQLTEEVVVAS